MKRVLLLASLFAAGCSPLGDDLVAEDDRRDGEIGREAMLAALSDHQDTFAELLRNRIGERGSMPGNYRTLLDGVGELNGCDEASESRFVVLSNEGFRPKTVITRCSQSSAEASEFFLALPATEDGDLDEQFVHVSSWDAVAGKYRIYSVYGDDNGEMAFNVEPKFCTGCHGGMYQADTWTPLMNELSNPWSQWHAEPDFPSQMFDEFAGPLLEEAPRASAVLANAASASGFEPIVRAGIERVTLARIAKRDDAASIGEALDLVRPLFCDESINFVSERHGTGRMAASSVIDGNIGDLVAFAGLSVDAGWYRDDQIVVAPASSSDAPLTLIGSRGEAGRQLELALVARQVIEPELALRIRALDWTRPVGSDYRCEQFEEGSRALREESDTTLGAATTAELVPLVIASMLPETPEGTLWSLADATRPELGHSASIGAFVDELSDYAASLDRSTIDRMRQERGCRAAAIYPPTPLFPDFRCD